MIGHAVSRSLSHCRAEIPAMRWHDGGLQIVQWADAAHLHGLPAQPSTAQQATATGP